jgi:hypothetical protein
MIGCPLSSCYSVSDLLEKSKRFALIELAIAQMRIGPRA